MARHLAEYLGEAGIECELVAREGQEHRANLVARVPGTEGGTAPSLAFVGHTDVVPVDARDWTHPPFEAVVDDDGYLWGRGALDMKGEVAARAVALKELVRSGWRPRGDLWFLAVADEEDGMADVGMRWLLEHAPRHPAGPERQRGRRRAVRADRRARAGRRRHRREGHLPGPGHRTRRGRSRQHARPSATTPCPTSARCSPASGNGLPTPARAPARGRDARRCCWAVGRRRRRPGRRARRPRVVSTPSWSTGCRRWPAPRWRRRWWVPRTSAT